MKQPAAGTPILPRRALRPWIMGRHPRGFFFSVTGTPRCNWRSSQPDKVLLIRICNRWLMECYVFVDFVETSSRGGGQKRQQGFCLKIGNSKTLNDSIVYFSILWTLSEISVHRPLSYIILGNYHMELFQIRTLPWWLMAHSKYHMLYHQPLTVLIIINTTILWDYC